MLTDRKREEERTGVQTSQPWGGEYDLQSDFVMVYRLNDTTKERVRQYKARGFIVHLMTGVSWGQYADYLDGAYDGKTHWDEAQVRMDGQRVMHGQTNPYMIPTIAFADYLAHKLRAAVDAGVDAIHLEEPEIWVFSGYSEAFKREWQLYYRRPWQPPHESADAYYRAGRLKAYLYTRAIGRIADAVKEYALVTYNRRIGFYVPTHSLINYAQYGISSPESMLMDLPCVDGYIAQVWSDTSRVFNVYKGVKKQRVFESAMLEYGIMQELTRGTGRRMWFLQDPISDKKCYTWDFYRACYLEGVTAALLQPHVSHYEICPWPHRVLTQRYPQPDGDLIPASYLTTLLCVTQALRDMDQPFEWIGGDDCAGVLLSDTMLYQRTYGYGYNPGTPYAEYGEESNLSGFYGLALPPQAMGMNIRPVQLDNVCRFPGYLDEYRLLVLSYEFMKPACPELHDALARFVQNGGGLVLVGDGSDPFAGIRAWWNQNGLSYDTPMAHLTDLLGLGLAPNNGLYAVGKGAVGVLNVHPAQIAYNEQTEKEYRTLLLSCRERIGMPEFIPKNYFALRRGPYIVAGSPKDSTEGNSFTLDGAFVDMMNPALPVLPRLWLKPGEYCLAADLSKYHGEPCLVCGAGRVSDWTLSGDTLTFTCAAPSGASCVLRIKSAVPLRVTADESSIPFDCDALGGTFRISFQGSPDGVRIAVFYGARGLDNETEVQA